MLFRSIDFCPGSGAGRILRRRLVSASSSSASSSLAWTPISSSSRPRYLHVSTRQHADNHYTTLGVSTTASAKEIKTAFFGLSKKHHPDHNPSDPSAAKRFMALSEAYNILSNTASRTKYDRDVLGLHASSSSSSSGAHPPGSYHSSSGYAGGRPASGLSKRRTHFQGPPPSFFRNGGWGAHSEKRREHQAGHYGPGSSSGDGAGGHGSAHPHGFAGAAPGMGPRAEPMGQQRDVPHFDHEAHLERQLRQDRRLRSKPSRGGDWDQPRTVGFFLFSLVLGAGLALPALVDRQVEKTRTSSSK